MDAAADGEAVWSWRRDRGVKLARSIGLTTVATNAAHRGEHEISRNTIARGKPGLFGCTCSSTPVLFFARGLRAQSAPGFPCALSPRRGTTRLQTSDKSCRGNENACAALRPQAALSSRRPSPPRLRRATSSLGRRSFSKGGRPGPIRRGGICFARWWSTFPQQLQPVVMGPGLRRGDVLGVSPPLPRGSAAASTRCLRPHFPAAIPLW
jgi:hypothetical protein